MVNHQKLINEFLLLSVTMKNPLELEERVRLGLIFEHDAYESFDKLAMCANGYIELTSEQKAFRQWHVDNAMKAVVYAGVSKDAIYVQKTADALKSNLNLMKNYDPELIDVNYKSTTNLVTNPWMLYLSILQLVRNADRTVDKSNGKISVDVDETGSLAKSCNNLIYLPKEAKSQGYFVKFSVTDNGPGFPKDRPLKDWLAPDASTNHGGFGLDFVRMACEYLNSGLGISSKPGETKITLYHSLRLRN